MQMSTEYFTVPHSHQQQPFQQMYGFPKSSNGSVLNLEYPIVIGSEEELDHFLGTVISSVGNALGNVAKAVDKVVPVSKVVKGIGDVASAVDKVVPISLMVPGGIIMRFAGDTALRVARGENVLDAIAKAGSGAYRDIRKGVQLASMVAGFVPGIGTGVGAALGAANALMNGEPITDAVIAAARGSLPGGAIAQTAFDMAANVAKGQNIGEAMLNTVRSRIPGGDSPLVRAAFDAGIALTKGQSLQQALLSSTGKLLPKSPFAESPLAFVSKVMSGQNIQTASLSKLGNLAHRKLQQTGLRIPGVGTLSLKRPGVPSRPPKLPGIQRATKLAPLRMRSEAIRDAAFARAQHNARPPQTPLLRPLVPAPQVAGAPTLTGRPARQVRYVGGLVAAPGNQVVGRPGVVAGVAAPGGYAYPAPPTLVPRYGQCICPPCPTCGDAVGDQEMNVGWQVWCPEENAQIGPTYYSSDQAFQTSSAHNSAFGHNSTVVPCTNC
jgi:hypothetical protein